MSTTPSGIPIRLCEACGREHPVTRSHCTDCGRASLFLDLAGICWRHRPEVWAS